LLYVVRELAVAAGLPVRAVDAVLGGVADDQLGSELFAVVGDGDGFDGTAGDEGARASNLRGDLEAVDEKPGALIVEPSGAELAENLGERELDGAPVFEHGDVDGLVGAGFHARIVLVDVDVEVAICLAFERRRLAAEPVGLDVPALLVHDVYPPLPYFVGKWSVFNDLERVNYAKILITLKLFSKR